MELLNAGHKVIVVDDLSNAKIEVPERVEKITGTRSEFFPYNCTDNEKLSSVFRFYGIDAMIHFAGSKAVGGRVKKPLEYYRNNLDTTLSLLEARKKFGCCKPLFSSSATVYGPNNPYPYKEEMPAIQSTSPYGWAKVLIERILTGYCTAYPDLCAVLLRYSIPSAPTSPARWATISKASSITWCPTSAESPQEDPEADHLRRRL